MAKDNKRKEQIKVVNSFCLSFPLSSSLSAFIVSIVAQPHINNVPSLPAHTPDSLYQKVRSLDE